jgi:hypothetical protein
VQTLMADIGAPDLTQPDPPSHAEVAVVVIARCGGEVLSAAVQALAEVSRGFGIEVLALVPSADGTTPGPGSLSLSVRLIAVDPREDEAVWRARAPSETSADILQFVDDRTAAITHWDEQMPLRLGIVRMDVSEAVGVRARLEHLAVPDPGPFSAGNR